MQAWEGEGRREVRKPRGAEPQGPPFVLGEPQDAQALVTVGGWEATDHVRGVSR